MTNAEMDWVFYSKNNQEMVDKFTRLGIIESSEVERAFRCVSRAAFVPDDLLDDAFKDTPLRGSHHVHLSAPHMYAAILEELELDVGMAFLNVGSGTGYFSTLAGYIIKKDGINHGIELHEDLVKFANEKINAFIENGPLDSKEICTPVLIAGNACRLDADQMKYDRLYCGAACTQSNVKFLLKMVKVGGFLIAPVGSRLIKLKRISLKEGRQSVINDVSFAPLVAATPEEMKLPKLRFPNACNKKSRKNSVLCDVSFPVSKSPGRKLLAKMRAYQAALDCLQNGHPLPMPYCYVPSYDDLCKAKSKHKSFKSTTTTTANPNESDKATTATNNLGMDHAAVDSQIDFFNKASLSSLSSDLSKDTPVAESTRQMESSSPVRRNELGVDWNYLSTNKTWLEVLEHYYSLCATTDARRNECTNVKVEKSDSLSEQLKILTFKKYAKQMGLLPSKSRKKSSKGEFKADSKGDAPVVEEVANDIVENLLEEVISQVDENDLAENFLAAVTGTGPYSDSDIRRRSSVARAIILDNLPRLRACAEEAGTLSPTLQTLIRNFDDEEKSHDLSEQGERDTHNSRDHSGVSRETSVMNMQAFVDNVIADIDKQILHDIAADTDVGALLEEDSIPPLQAADSSDTSSVGQSTDQQGNLYPIEDSEGLSKGGISTLGSFSQDSAIEKSIVKDDGIVTARPVLDDSQKVNLQTHRVNPDLIYFKRDTSSFFAPREVCAPPQGLPGTCDRKQLSSFHPHNTLQKPVSSLFVLLEQRNALLKEKGVASINIDDAKLETMEEKYWERGLPRSCTGDLKGVEEKEWDRGLPRIGANTFDVDTNPFRCSSFISSDGEMSSNEGSFSFMKNSCLDNSSESTPCMAFTSAKKPQYFDLRVSSSSQCYRGSPAHDELSFDERDIGRSESSNAKELSLENTHQLDGNESFNMLEMEHRLGIFRDDIGSASSRAVLNNNAVRKRDGGFAVEETDTSNTALAIDKESGRSMFFSDTELLRSVARVLTNAAPVVKEHVGSVSETSETTGEIMDAPNLIVDGNDNSVSHPSVSFPEIDVNSSLVASTPVHIATSIANTMHDATKIETITENSTDVIDKGTVNTEPKNQLPSERSTISKKYQPPFTTHYTSSFRKRRKLRKAFMTIKMDVPSSKMLRSLPGKDWSMKHDKELVLYLSRKEKMSGHVAFSNCCASVITPKCFSSTDLLQYKKICSFPADALSRRGIVLKRLAEVLDSVMNMLVGPSLMRDQFKTPYDEECSLQSFTEASFESSGIPLHLNSGSAVGNASQVNKEVRNADESALESKQKTATQDLMETVDAMMQKEIENVKKQMVIVLAKLKLYHNLNAEYDEQLRLIKEQLGLVIEQQQLLQTRLRGRFQDENSSQSMLQTEQMIQERKLHRKHLSDHLEALKAQIEEKAAEHESVLQIYKQLVNLEDRLVEERNKSMTMGWKYIEKESGKLKSFTQCVEKCNEIFDKLSGMGGVLDDNSAADNVAFDDTLEEDTEDHVVAVKESTGKSKYRYHPHLLLAKSRFLFPLTSKRLGIIKELLRISETDSLHPCNVARIDRRMPLKERHKYPPSNTVFMQTYNALKNKELNFRDAKRHFEKLWEVKFIGEGIIDQGGGFRDSLAEIADELCPASAEVKECLNFFIKTPNQKNEVGDNRDAYIPNPTCKDYHVYTWIGKLIGAAFRTDETVPLAFPPLIWKLLIGDTVTWALDYKGVDETIVRVTDGMELLDEDTYNELYGLDQTHTVHLSDGSEYELISGGSRIPVKPKDRADYARLVRRTRLMESEKQVRAMRDGLVTVVPEALLSCLTWQDFERGVCGSPEITVEDLKANCRYELDLSPTVDCVSFLWEALVSFTSEERSKFIRFVTGRRRLPSPFFISRCSNDDQHLPSASTCGSNLFLPNYTDAKTAAEKIRYAINNCVSIDTDTSPW